MILILKSKPCPSLHTATYRQHKEVRPWLGANLQCISQHTTESAFYPLCQPGIKGNVSAATIVAFYSSEHLITFQYCLLISASLLIFTSMVPYLSYTLIFIFSTYNSLPRNLIPSIRPVTILTLCCISVTIVYI